MLPPHGANSQEFIHSSSILWTLPIKTQGHQSAVLLSCFSLGVARLFRAHASGWMLCEPGTLEPRGPPWPGLAEHAALLTGLWANGSPQARTQVPIIPCETQLPDVTAGGPLVPRAQWRAGHTFGQWDPFQGGRAHACGLQSCRASQDACGCPRVLCGRPILVTVRYLIVQCKTLNILVFWSFPLCLRDKGLSQSQSSICSGHFILLVNARPSLFLFLCFCPIFYTASSKDIYSQPPRFSLIRYYSFFFF